VKFLKLCTFLFILGYELINGDKNRDFIVQ